MLVLNTGQTPWNTRRQIEVIYGNLSRNIERELYNNYPELKEKIDIYGIDDGKYRTLEMLRLMLQMNWRKNINALI